jgi:hypothetical protein
VGGREKREFPLATLEPHCAAPATYFAHAVRHGQVDEFVSAAFHANVMATLEGGPAFGRHWGCRCRSRQSRDADQRVAGRLIVDEDDIARAPRTLVASARRNDEFERVHVPPAIAARDGVSTRAFCG